MPRASSQSSARPPLPPSGAEPASVGVGSAPVGPSPPEALSVTFAPITFTSGGATYCTESISLVAKRVSAAQPGPAGEPPDLDKAGVRLAIKVFQLLLALDPGNRLRKAPPIKVFVLYYLRRLEPAEIARICDCHRSLIFIRLTAIQDKLPWTPKQLQELAPWLEAVQEAMTDSRAEHISPLSAAFGAKAAGSNSD